MASLSPVSHLSDLRRTDIVLNLWRPTTIAVTLASSLRMEMSSAVVPTQPLRFALSMLNEG